MEIRRVRALRGPNIWARFPVIEALVDLQELKDTSSDSIPGFNDRLKTWLPTMIEHRCGVGMRGGFFQRLDRGTWMGHILEHVVLELQSLAYKGAGFGKARETPEEGVYRVVFRYRDEDVARACLDTAFALCLAAVYDQPFDIAAELEKLRAYAKTVALPEIGYQVLAAARERDIPALRLNAAGVLQLGHGHKQRKVYGLSTDRTPLPAVQIAQDKELVETLLKSVQVNPAGETLGTLHRLLMVDGDVAAAVRVEPSGELVDVTAKVHHEVATHAADAADIVGLDIAGVDVRATDISKPLGPQQGGIVDVHCQVDLDSYLGDQKRIEQTASDIVDYLYPTDDTGRIPIACVTGCNGKTTTTRLLAQLVAGAGYKTGMTCTDGVFIDGRRIEAGDCSGPKSARNILRHPEIEAAVFEVARGGILREGLGFDRADVSIVTNIGEGDHLGMQYINTPADLAYVKSTVIDVVKPDVGTAVLNAADPLTAAMHEHCRGRTTYFALDPQHPVLIAHREQGGTAAIARDGQLIMAQGSQETVILPLAEIPLTRGGRISFQIENVLAATAAAWALQLPIDVIRRELKQFDSDMSQTPGRFNVLEFNGATVIVDYGHNPPALVAMLDAIQSFPHQRRTVVYSAAGDRRDCDILRQGEILGQSFDTVILYEDQYLRGRAQGEITSLFRQGMETENKRAREVHEVVGWRKAATLALEKIQPGELLLVQADVVDESVEFIRELLAMCDSAREIKRDAT